MGYANLGPVKYLTIHCAATPDGRNVKADTISKWDIERFGQISYHYVIELDGHVVKTLDLKNKGAHVGKANTGNIGICYVGGVDVDNKTPEDTRTPAQKAAMRNLVATLKELYPDIKVRGHRDWPGVAKACPSFDVAAWLKQEGLA